MPSILIGSVVMTESVVLLFMWRETEQCDKQNLSVQDVCGFNSSIFVC